MRFSVSSSVQNASFRETVLGSGGFSHIGTAVGILDRDSLDR